ncbi:MAG: tetratricopeptide repeat protein [Ferruginibacter sp.]
MKKISLLFAAVILVNISNAQSSINDSLRNHYQKTYQQALQYNDINVAINSLQNIIAETPGNAAVPMKDTLAMLYFASKSYYSSLLLSKEVFQANPSNINALARAAECNQNLGETKEAIADYEKVTPVLKNPYYYYQLAVCQYGLKRIVECEANIRRVLADSNSNKIGVSFTLPNGAEQQVPVSAAVLNMAAVMKMDTKNYAEAKAYLESALKIFPDFEGARQNLNYCNENLKSRSTKPAANPKGKG